jgi:hypothetical protein
VDCLPPRPPGPRPPGRHWYTLADLPPDLKVVVDGLAVQKADEAAAEGKPPKAATDSEKVFWLYKQVFRSSKDKDGRGGGRTPRGALCEALTFALLQGWVEAELAAEPLAGNSMSQWLGMKVERQLRLLEQAYHRLVFTVDHLRVLDHVEAGEDPWWFAATRHLEAQGLHYPAEASQASANMRVSSLPVQVVLGRCGSSGISLL